MRSITSLVLASILTLGIAGTATAGGNATARGTTTAASLPALRLFGQTWCFGATPGVACDVTLPIASAAPAAPHHEAATSRPAGDSFMSRFLRAARSPHAG